mgnify:CR=1 FL=1
MLLKFTMKSVLFAFLVFTVVVACKKDDRLENEIVKINTNIELERFDSLFAAVTMDELPKLKASYPFMFSDKYPDSFWLDKKGDTLQLQLFNEVAKTFVYSEDLEVEIEEPLLHHPKG